MVRPLDSVVSVFRAAQKPLLVTPRIEGTILDHDAKDADIKQLAEAAKDFGWAGACVYPEHIRFVAPILKGSGIKAVSVVGFPNGDIDTDQKIVDAWRAITNGAHHLDMVINIQALKAKDDKAVQSDIQEVVNFAHAWGVKVKVIKRAERLSDEELVRGSRLAIWGGADYLKRSTGKEDKEFKLNGNNALRYHQLDLMHSVIRENQWKQLFFQWKIVRMKDSGEISDLETGKGSIAHGADLLGISFDKAVKISEAEKKILKAIEEKFR